MTPEKVDDWTRYQHMVLDRLDMLSDQLKEIDVRIRALEVGQAVLYTKATLLGGGAGIFAYALTSVVEFLKRRP